MNYFAHGVRFLEDPYFLAGTAVPDWLSVVDRRSRISSKAATPFLAADEPRLAALAAGIVQHHRDDEWFHGTPAFVELNLDLTGEIRAWLPGDESFRPSFLAHILVEILLDAELIAERPERLDTYYQRMESLDPGVVCRAVDRMATRPAPQLEVFIPLFSAERFLCDYAEDDKLLGRLNRVLKRVGLPPLPESFRDFLPGVRRRVHARRGELFE